jgi:hypothetical protein
VSKGDEIPLESLHEEGHEAQEHHGDLAALGGAAGGERAAPAGDDP